MRLETERLILRPWRDEDRAPYAQMMADPEVGYWLGGTLTAAQVNAQIDRAVAQLADGGPSMVAVERRSDGVFLGASGLMLVHVSLPLAGEVEIEWRLARAAWGVGYATEAAGEVARYGFGELGLETIVAFTAVSNHRSRAVMERLGFERQPWRDFDHPNLALDHPLRRHVVYALSRNP
ncbi:MAG TPA: GNAT family N-acetyltransferase [Caulobacteraceae bacterium]|jgi:RimJ/RimL family protein N-acetyltransferase